MLNNENGSNEYNNVEIINVSAANNGINNQKAKRHQ
jgi:hypothetical protein